MQMEESFKTLTTDAVTTKASIRTRAIVHTRHDKKATDARKLYLQCERRNYKSELLQHNSHTQSQYVMIYYH
jgi:hypothetical protein